MIAEYAWYNDSLSTPAVVTGTLEGVSNNTPTLITTLAHGNTTAGNTWYCSVRAYDGGQYSTYINASRTVNTPPSQVTLVQPTNGNQTIRNLTPLFNWTAATDADGDDINYTINITYSVGCDNLPHSNSTINATNFTTSFDLCTYSGGTAADRYYNWTVTACDFLECGTTSEIFNFSIQPWVSINLTTSGISFGSMNNGETNDTTDDSPPPFVLVNDGNTVADLVNISANASLWSAGESVGLGTEYLQLKADNVSGEEGAFNYSDSMIDWFNASSNNESIIKQLNYSDSLDSAEVDIKVTVPNNETAGQRNTWFIFSFTETPS